MSTSLIRSLLARHEKACRGELVVAAPVGFVKAGDRYEKDPARRVKGAISLVFDKVEELGSARQALLWFHEHKPRSSRQAGQRRYRWRRPSYATLRRIVENPSTAAPVSMVEPPWRWDTRARSSA